MAFWNDKSHLETIWTLVSYCTGLAIAALDLPLVLALLPLCCCPLLPIFNHLSVAEQCKIQGTMVLFGLANGWCLSLTPISALIWLNTARFYGQFQLINNYHHPTLAWNSFLIYHSLFYTLANVFALFEHLLDFPYKGLNILFYPALALSFASMVLRVLAFFTARSNFTHQVSYFKKTSHQLITTGVYSWFRHPSYTGFFYFSVSTMLMISNYISAAVFACALMFFFQDRIQCEEYYLHIFFGKQYASYCQHTHILIPRLPQPVFKWLKKRRQ